ncbi:nitrate- and nitrite sensing domain-containing protein [Kutzneria albida]|uniref:histidine kinase n=1 Tax=Kutzneria albida DSM 43870 TaxID=1449976 RepID=W5W4V0_9PSEU|nr:nitrate- and nitrite sensing domain-containing protein [Kutzneria albida]AHH96253.1 two-component system sensor kinase [Kutzneria albida DSM 43870]
MKNKSETTAEHGSIRTRLAGVVLIPSITLIVMWVAAASYLVFDGFYARQVASGVRDVSIPAVTALGSAQKERQLSVAYLGRPAIGLRALHDQQQQTDQALTSMKTAITAILDNAPDEVVQRVRTLNTSLDQLPRIRSAVDTGGIDRTQVYAFYNTLLDAATSLFDTQARIVPDVTATQGGIAATSVFRASDLMSRASSVISGAFSTSQLSTADHLDFTSLVGSYHAELDKTAPFLREAVAEKYRKLTATDSWHKLVDAENGLIERGAWPKGTTSGLPISESDWDRITNQVSNDLIAMTVTQADEVSAQALSDGNGKLVGVLVGSILALLAAIVAIIVAMRVSSTLVDKALVTRLARLRAEALELATHRLPDIVRRLRAGETVDVREEMPDLNYGRDEIGQLAVAFNAAQYTAVSAAVTEAQARDGVHNVFLGIAHRNQGLVHRQLKILDAMERGEEDPQRLERLFQLDHLATRARRNAENLIILGGEQPGRRWRKAVQLVDVLRAAVSETELYHRVQVQHGPDVAVVGAAVADTIHLIAELVDNATTFSPPRSQVLVSSVLVAKGVVVEVEDQGLGMSEGDRDRANAMMADPPEFDAMALKADSRLGLFVIARLAHKLEINVEFRVSPYGGTRAIVLIPTQVLARRQDLESVHEREVPAQPEQEQVADSLSGTELDEFWALSRSRLAESVRTTPPPVVEPVLAPQWPEHEPARDEGPHTDSLAIPQGRPEGAKPQLPQRQPQSSLAPQLRGDLNDESEVDGEPAERSPEEVRDTMAAFQRGTRLGRADQGVPVVGADNTWE